MPSSINWGELTLPRVHLTRLVIRDSSLAFRGYIADQTLSLISCPSFTFAIALLICAAL